MQTLSSHMTLTLTFWTEKSAPDQGASRSSSKPNLVTLGMYSHILTDGWYCCILTPLGKHWL